MLCGGLPSDIIILVSFSLPSLGLPLNGREDRQLGRKCIRILTGFEYSSRTRSLSPQLIQLEEPGQCRGEQRVANAIVRYIYHRQTRTFMIISIAQQRPAFIRLFLLRGVNVSRVCVGGGKANFINIWRGGLLMYSASFDRDRFVLMLTIWQIIRTT